MTKYCFCEVCGVIANRNDKEGWLLCDECYYEPKPSRPLYDWETGKPVNLGVLSISV
jgi:hypothetical protein